MTMRQIRDILSDLVERRLWPVALLLVGALVAVPLVLAKSPEDAQPSSSTPPAALVAATRANDTDAGEPAVSLSTGTSAGAAKLHGRDKDPFKQQHVPKKTDVGGEGGSPSGAPTTGTGGGAGSGGPGTGSGGGTGTPTGPKLYAWTSIDVRFGKALGHLKKIRNVRRLRPLPSTAHPVVIFLGMRKDHETAVFLVSTDVNVQGQIARCVPSRKVCKAIELHQGDTAFLDWENAQGIVTQYELDLDDVTVHQTTSKALAQAGLARVSRAGRRLLRHRTAATSRGRRLAPPRALPYRYAPQQGVLHIALRAYHAQLRRLAARRP